MARYDKYGKQDDQIVEDLDQGFVGFNNKFRPDQLRAGILTESNNGRMDLNGEWQPRKGMEIFSTPFDAAVFTVPFRIHAPLPSVSSYARSGEVLTVNFGSAHGITTGDIVNLSGLTAGGTVDPNGNRSCTASSTTQIQITIT